MRAYEARQIMEYAKGKNLESRRAKILDCIQRRAELGESYLIVDEKELNFKLTDEDWKYFEDLGYIVDNSQPHMRAVTLKPTPVQSVPQLGTISW